MRGNKQTPTKILNNTLVRGMTGVISFYQIFLSPFLTTILGIRCRYEETCSRYAKRVITYYGVRKGGVLAFQRLLSCQPFARIQQQ